MEKSHTSKAQRIGIWVIIVFMAVGSVGAYFAMIVANNNANDPELQKQEEDQAQKEYMKQMEEQQKAQQEAEAKTKKEPLDGYAAEAFDVASVTELKIDELKPGDGKVAKKDSTVEVNYFGWTSDGKIFDSSKKDGKVQPISFPLNGVIPGWTEGLTGAKEGSVRKLTIPADKAYGETTQNGQPSGPLQFIVELKSIK